MVCDWCITMTQTYDVFLSISIESRSRKTYQMTLISPKFAKGLQKEIHLGESTELAAILDAIWDFEKCPKLNWILLPDFVLVLWACETADAGIDKRHRYVRMLDDVDAIGTEGNSMSTLTPVRWIIFRKHEHLFAIGIIYRHWMTEVVTNPLPGRQRNRFLNRHQNHGWWWQSNTMNQDINSHATDPSSPENFRPQYFKG